MLFSVELEFYLLVASDPRSTFMIIFNTNVTFSQLSSSLGNSILLASITIRTLKHSLVTKMKWICPGRSPRQILSSPAPVSTKPCLFLKQSVSTFFCCKYSSLPIAYLSLFIDSKLRYAMRSVYDNSVALDLRVIHHPSKLGSD